MLLWNVFAQVLLPILVMVAFGWILDRRTRLDLHTLVKLNIYLFVPAFIFVHLVESNLGGVQAFRVVVFTLTIIAAMFILGGLAGRLMGFEKSQTRSLQLAAMFYNSGNYGVPLMTLAYPAVGPVLQVFVIVTQNISTFTVGLALAASTHRGGWRIALPMLRQVTLWAALSAVVVRLFHLPVQSVGWIWTPLRYSSDAVVAFALVTLGAQLSQTPARQSFSRLGWALGIRLLIAPLLAFLLVPLFGFRGEEATVMIVSTAFPTAVNTALLAHEFKADSHFAAAAVFYSTLFSMVTVTVLIAMLQMAHYGIAR